MVRSTKGLRQFVERGLSIYDQLVPNRGAILIPTREGEHGRFNFKCGQGATYGMTQLLYSDAIVGFLTEFAKTTEHRPEILLSFGFVPKVETRIGLINWLIQDPGNAAVADEQAFVTQLAETDPAQKRKLMIDLYKRVIDGVADLGFPLSIHLEAAYGASAPAPARAVSEKRRGPRQRIDPKSPPIHRGVGAPELLPHNRWIRAASEPLNHFRRDLATVQRVENSFTGEGFNYPRSVTNEKQIFVRGRNWCSRQGRNRAPRLIVRKIEFSLRPCAQGRNCRRRSDQTKIQLAVIHWGLARVTFG